MAVPSCVGCVHLCPLICQKHAAVTGDSTSTDLDGCASGSAAPVKMDSEFMKRVQQHGSSVWLVFLNEIHVHSQALLATDHYPEVHFDFSLLQALATRPASISRKAAPLYSHCLMVCLVDLKNSSHGGLTLGISSFAIASQVQTSSACLLPGALLE